ncbi:hypothetical protein ANCDUO_11287 [Ancylostoma duodenale]|uniref:Uncharacterized protein n=1 Tax=Ancylostoma duodenale TaxID=51022 RepID=A0A0C2D8L4_9BILA|nr:hypothetical protein ANCDUO_11287 [Ancylostoma duodenale]
MALSPKYLARENRVDEKPEQLTALGESLGPNTALITDPELQQLSDYESVPRLSLPSERIGFVHPDKVKVRADCHDTGMNVSFHIDGNNEDKVVSVVIVMSNDRVLPHDVTTKDDLFFHVTCNYSTPVVDQIRQGIVVG